MIRRANAGSRNVALALNKTDVEKRSTVTLTSDRHSKLARKAARDLREQALMRHQLVPPTEQGLMEKVHGQLFRTNMTSICRNIQLSGQPSWSQNNTNGGVTPEDRDCQRPDAKINGRRVDLEDLKFRTTAYGRVYKEFDANDFSDQELLLQGQGRRASQPMRKFPR